MQKNQVFLNKEISNSIAGLLETLAGNMKKSSPASIATVVIMMRAAITVLQSMGMNEELRLLVLLTTSRFGEKGLAIPEEIANLVSPSASPTTIQWPVVSKPKPIPASSPVATKPTSVVAVKTAPAPKPGTIISAGTAPARTLSHGGDFAAKLGRAAGALGKGPLAEFRQLMAEDGKGTEYWNKSRESVSKVFEGKLLEDVDWPVLIAKLKRNIFFSDRERTRLFLEQCPKEHVLDLLIGEGQNLRETVRSINTEMEFNPISVYQLNFAIECSLAVGKDAKEVLTACKHAVNRMKQKGFIRADHWLAQKVTAMTSHTPIPAQKYADPSSLKVEESPVSVASADPEVPSPKGEKDVVDPEAEKQFAQFMLKQDEEQKGSAPVNGVPVPPADLPEGIITVETETVASASLS